MKHTSHTRTPGFDASAIHATIQRALEAAGLLQARPTFDDPSVIDVVARWAPGPAGPAPAHQPAGHFDTQTFTNEWGSRAYKVHVPATGSGAPRPMVVMLHGCTQSADDFAAGTQMNRLADEHGFIVVYPEQAASANPSRCWNWFSPKDQRRGAGEPALVAGLVREVAHTHGADPRRIYVAGLSAGAAMAVVLGETYPELFAGVGAHSGLAYGSAHDIPSALAAMKGGRGRTKHTAPLAPAPQRKAVHAVPTIVFHGDRDHTVEQANGAHIVLQAQQAHHALAGHGEWQVSTHTGATPPGRRYTRTVHADAQGFTRIEAWVLHGAGHAWSGGHASGSYTDAAGPDASAEMVRFFMALPAGGAA